MAVLSKSDCEVELRVDKLHQDTRVDGGVVGWNLEHSQLAIVEGKSLDSLCIELDSLSDLDELISSCELECGSLLPIMEDGDSNGPQPSVVPGSVIRNKESIHLKLLIADKVEGGVVQSLESVAEQTSSL